jgi:hypothetical protein
MPAMTITVVTTRTDNGAPATRDVYAGTVRYTTTNGNLEVISAKRAPLAFYGSGNWLSVYVDQCVTVISDGSVVTVGDDSVDVGRGGLDDTAAGPAPDIATEADADEPEAPAEQLPTTDVAEDLGIGDRDDEPDPVEIHRGNASEPTTSRPDNGRGPWMRAVVIRPRVYTSPPPDPGPAAPPNPRMRQVPVRPKLYTSSPKDVEPVPPRNPRMRKVPIRPRTQQRPPVGSEADDGEEETSE